MLANSRDPNQTLHSAASDLDLHFLSFLPQNEHCACLGCYGFIVWMHRLFDGKVLWDLLIFLPKIS